MKISRYIFNLLIIINGLFIIISCDSEKNKNYYPEKFEIQASSPDKEKLLNAIELNEQVKVEQFTNFKIVSFEKSSSKIYIELDSQPGSYYYTTARIDSVINMNILNLEEQDHIYIGKFKFISENYGDFTFLAVNSYDKSSGKHLNLFNDYFILDNAKPDIVICENFTGPGGNALLVSYSEGTGNYLDFRIYGLHSNKFGLIFEPKSPLENGVFAIDSGAVYLLEGIITSKITYKDGKVKSELLESTPIFNESEHDFTLNLKLDNNGNLILPKFIVLKSNSVLQISFENQKYRQEKNLRINFDSDYLDQNFTAFVPKKSGMTTIEFINNFNIPLGKIRVIIN